jgi:hypothetical protein
MFRPDFDGLADAAGRPARLPTSDIRGRHRRFPDRLPTARPTSSRRDDIALASGDIETRTSAALTSWAYVSVLKKVLALGR